MLHNFQRSVTVHHFVPSDYENEYCDTGMTSNDMEFIQNVVKSSQLPQKIKRGTHATQTAW